MEIVKALLRMIVQMGECAQEFAENSAHQNELEVCKRKAEMLEMENDELRRENAKLQNEQNSLRRGYDRLANKVVKLSSAVEKAEQRTDAEHAARTDAEKRVEELSKALASAVASQSVTEEALAKATHQLGQNSTNSSKPPSSDPPGTRKPKSPNEHNTRNRSGKKRGGQTGHKGSTLTKEAVRKLIEDGECEHKVITVGSGEGTYRTRYVVNIETRLVVEEYRIFPNEDGSLADLGHWKNPVMYGDEVRALAAQLYSLGTLSHAKIRELIRALTGDVLPIAAGTIYNIVKKMARLAQPTIAELKKELSASGVLFTDATNVHVGTGPGYVRNLSTETIDLLVAMASKNLEALGQIDVLADFTGILMHDHETAMYHFGGEHAECNVHLDRYLKGILELVNSRSAQAFRALLYEIKEAVEQHGGALDEQDCETYSQRYDSILQQWRTENETRQYDFVRRKELTLTNRLEKYKDAHLRFMRDGNIPFDNNRSERAVRLPKIHSKVTGGFRTHAGNEMSCALFSIAQTCKLRGIPTMAALRQLSASEFHADFVPVDSPLLYGAYVSLDGIAEQ